MCVCVRACVRACLRACVRACVLGVPLCVFYYALHEQVCLLIYFMLLTSSCVFYLKFILLAQAFISVLSGLFRFCLVIFVYIFI